MPPKKIFDNIERDRARVTKILRTTDVTLGDTGPITITGKLSKESRESLVDSIMDSLQLRWTDEEKLFWAASRCEHSAREITVAESHIFGESWLGVLLMARRAELRHEAAVFGLRLP